MQEILEQHCLEKDTTGLLLLSMPTGFGKTHNILDFIYKHYRDFAEQKRKIFFITNLKKNLPVLELKERFKADNAEDDYDKHVIFINSNSDSVINNLLSIDSQIPERFKVKSYLDLKSYVETLKNSGRMDKKVKTALSEQIRKELEPNFRKIITKQLNQEFKTKAEKLDAVKTNPDYQWIGDLYPAVFTDEKIIIFLSIDKFVRKNTPIIEGSYYFQKRLIDGSLIFIDEFDATKENVLESIIKSGLDSRVDLLDLFLNIHNHLMENECPEILLQESKQRERMASEKGWPSLHEIVVNFQRKADLIFKKYNLQHTCKSSSNFSSNKRNFLFYDYQFHHVLDAQHKRIEVVQDTETRTNWIMALEGNERRSGVNIRSLLREIAGFLTYFQNGVEYLAENYCQLKNEDDTVQEVYPLDIAIKTVLNNFHLDSGTVKFLTDSIMEHNTPYELRGKTNAIQEHGFYDAGFSYYDIVDSDEHDTLSKIYRCTFSRTPESFLVEVCSRAMVVGMSATAGLYTNIGNYDLEYLRSRLRSSFVRPSGAALQRITEAISETNRGYEQVSIKTEFIGTDDFEESLARLESLMEDREAANALWNVVRGSNPEEQDPGYIFSRYVRALTAWNYFLENTEIRAFLCFFNAFPKRSNPRFDLETLYQYAGRIQSRYPDMEGKLHSDTIVVLTGENFDKKKPELLEALKSGERRFIISTYQTIGAGQNLQYAIPESTHPIKINGFPDRGLMDIDAIYVDRPTHLLVNINSDDLKNDDFIKYLFQLEFLVEDGSISPKTFERKLDEAFSRLVGRYKKKKHVEDYISLYQTEAYTRYLNKIVIQAIGRICRTNMKSPTIHVLADSFIRRHLVQFILPDDVIPVREYTALLESARGKSAISDEYVGFQNRASNRSNWSATFIHGFLKNPWNRSKVELWQNLREQTLKQPSIPSKENCDPKWHPIYVELPSPARSYKYIQENDYQNIEVFFSPDKQTQEVSERAARLQELMAIKPLYDLFNDRGWATGFAEGELMLTPPIFNNIYKGALGEVCGRYILQEQLGLQLSELDISEYEMFDFKTENNVYFDFKLWNDHIAVPAENIILNIKDKMKGCNADRVFVINILGESRKEFRPIISSERRIVEIPFVCQDGSLSDEALVFIQKELLK